MESKVNKETASYMVHVLHKTLRETGEHFGVTRERIRQIVGNVNKIAHIEDLRTNRAFWQDRLYVQHDITIERIAEQRNISPKSVLSAIGSEISYLNSLGKRRCTRCKEIKYFYEFYPNGNGYLGQPCKKCATIRHREWHSTHKESQAKYLKEYWSSHREKANEIQRRFRIKHPEKMRAIDRRYYQTHREEIRIRDRARYRANVEKNRARSRELYALRKSEKENPSGKVKIP